MPLMNVDSRKKSFLEKNPFWTTTCCKLLTGSLSLGLHLQPPRHDLTLPTEGAKKPIFLLHVKIKAVTMQARKGLVKAIATTLSPQGIVGDCRRAGS